MVAWPKMVILQMKSEESTGGNSIPGRFRKVHWQDLEILKDFNFILLERRCQR